MPSFTAEAASLPLVPVPSGQTYRVVSPPEDGLVVPRLAAELARVLERFAREAGFDPARPVSVTFKPGVVGHHKAGRAADLYAVGGRGLDAWKRDWEMAVQRGQLAAECRRNLGWRLYKAIQSYGRWAQPSGYPVQLFGPWTRSEGPWTWISDRLLAAHHDHIHVAK